MVELFLDTFETDKENLPDRYGDTPLHYACKNGHYRAMEILLENVKNDEIFVKNDCGKTPKDYAKAKDWILHLKLIEYLGEPAAKKSKRVV